MTKRTVVQVVLIKALFSFTQFRLYWTELAREKLLNNEYRCFPNLFILPPSASFSYNVIERNAAFVSMDTIC